MSSGSEGNGWPLEAKGLSKVFTGGDGRPLAILDGVDFAAKRGEMVAFVGESGARKSTILKLLPRFYSPQTGAITLCFPIPSASTGGSVVVTASSGGSFSTASFTVT